MIRNVTLRKFLALVLSLALTLSLTTAALATENVGSNIPTCDGTLGCQDGSHAENCPLYTKNPDIENPGDPSKDITTPPACTEDEKCTLTEGHTEKCPSHPDNAAAINAVQALIEALPTEVTADNQADVEAKLGEIQSALTALKNDACRAMVNITRYTTAKDALNSLSALNSGNPSGGEKKDEQPAPPPAAPAPEDPAPEDPAPEDPAPENPAPEGPAPEDPAPEDPAPEDPAPEDPAPEDPAPEDPAPEDPAPEDPAPEDPAPEDPAPEDPAPEDPAPENPAPPADPTPAEKLQQMIDALPGILSALNPETDLEAANAEVQKISDFAAANGLELTEDQENVILMASEKFYPKNTGDSFVADINGQGYPTLQEAFANAATGSTIKILSAVSEPDAEITFDNKAITLDLNGQSVSLKSLTAGAGSSLTIQDSTAVNPPSVGTDYAVSYTSGKLTVSGAVYAASGASVTLNSGTVFSTKLGLYAGTGSTVTVNGGYIDAQEFAVTAQGSGATIHFKSGVARARDNAVIAGNGSAGLGGTTINVSGGTLIGEIISAGYASCGIYHPQTGTLTITGGKIYSAKGCGVLMRSGTMRMTGGTIDAKGDPAAVGKVGDSGVTVPASGVVFDRDANYSGAESVKVEISGTASVSGSKSAIDIVDNNIQATAGQIAVSGGTFSSAVEKEYCAVDYLPQEIKDESGNVIGYGVHKHAETLEVKNAVEATCSKEGYDGDKVCPDCGQILETGHAIPKLDHKYGDWVYHVADCTKGGTRVHTCTVCGAKAEENVAGTTHSYDKNTWSSNEAAHWHDCTICGSKAGIEDHIFQWVAVSRAASGTKVQMCTTCGYESDTDWSKLELTLGSNRTTVRPGKTITYTLTVTNKTGMDMDEVVVSGDLGKNLTFTKATGDGKYDSKNSLWTISNLEAGKSASLTLKVTVKSGVKSGTKLEYTATVTDAEAYNGETYPDKSLSSLTSTVKVSSSSVYATNPKTGDPNNVVLWITVMGVSLAALIALIVILVIKSRKKK